MQGRSIGAVFGIRTGQHDTKDNNKGKCVVEEESSEEGGESREEEEQEQETTGTMLLLSGGLAENERVCEAVYIPMLTTATQYERELHSNVAVIKLAKLVKN
jgi:ABC-type transporter Mla maintaining outer membrane lipid asymmetry ATPase subunit MlaF